jgi:hypothetical protein
MQLRVELQAKQINADRTNELISRIGVNRQQPSFETATDFGYCLGPVPNPCEASPRQFEKISCSCHADSTDPLDPSHPR